MHLRDNKKRIAASAILLFALIALAMFSFAYTIKPASAHISKKFGNLTVELGWNNEPALTDQMNAAQLTVYTGSIDKPQYVINAVANLQTTLVYGTTTKSITFLPSPTTEGQYLATILPTREGTYTVTLKGTINGQNIDTQIPLDDVADVNTVAFPAGTGGGISGGTGTTGGAISPDIASQLGGIINQLTNDINSAKSSADSAAQNAADAQKTVQDAKSSADRAYLVGMTGIGVGIAGIAIAVVAISKREKLLER
jgi:hypothetical protein